jgi:transcription antitermination factor NusG
MRVLEAPGVIRIIGSKGRLTPLPDEEIDALASAVKIRK